MLRSFPSNSPVGNDKENNQHHDKDESYGRDASNHCSHIDARIIP